MSSSTGTAPNRGCPSTRLSLRATGFTLRTGNSRRERSMGRLAAVRRLVYEAADAGLLSPELAAGIRRVKGVKKLGVRLGNWLTAEEARRLWQAPDTDTLKGKRDRAMLAVLLGCGLRRRELADLESRVPASTATRAALGHRRPCRQRWAYPNRARIRLGEGNGRCLDYGSWFVRRQGLSMCLPRRQNLGRRRDRTGSLAHSAGRRLSVRVKVRSPTSRADARRSRLSRSRSEVSPLTPIQPWRSA
jgi:integrase